MSHSLNTKSLSPSPYLVTDESDLDRIKSPIYKTIYTEALAMQSQALVELIKLEQSSNIYNYIHNPISTGTCLISDRRFTLPDTVNTYTLRFHLPRFGDAIQNFKIRLPDGHKVTSARAQLYRFTSLGSLTTRYESCFVHHKAPYFNALAYTELFVIGYDNIWLELVCEREVSNGVSSHQVKVWADYIFYSTNERSKKLFNPVN
jgi:hypothetical protein